MRVTVYVYDIDNVGHQIDADGEVVEWGYPPHRGGEWIPTTDSRFYDPGEDDIIEFDEIALDGEEASELDLPEEWLNKLKKELREATLEYRFELSLP